MNEEDDVNDIELIKISLPHDPKFFDHNVLITVMEKPNRLFVCIGWETHELSHVKGYSVTPDQWDNTAMPNLRGKYQE